MVDVGVEVVVHGGKVSVDVAKVTNLSLRVLESDSNVVALNSGGVEEVVSFSELSLEVTVVLGENVDLVGEVLDGDLKVVEHGLEVGILSSESVDLVGEVSDLSLEVSVSIS